MRIVAVVGPFAAAPTVAFLDFSERWTGLDEVGRAFERAGWNASASTDSVNHADVLWALGDPFAGDYPGVDPASGTLNHLDGLQVAESGRPGRA